LRPFVVTLLAALLTACSSSPPETPSRAVSTLGPIATITPTSFGDTDPHEWLDVTPWQYPVHGIDISKYQGDVDWFRVRGSGTAFAFIKATEGGDHADDRFLDNWRAAAQAGMPRGAYHYYYFCRTAAEQASWFISHVPQDRGALPPVLDVEWNHRSRTCPLRPDAGAVRSEMRVFLKTVGRYYGKRPMIYTTVDFYQDNQLWLIQDYEFWLRSVAGHPSDVYPGQNWRFWQYTGTGVVPGIDGQTDINVFAGSYPQWQGWMVANMR
jgi:lysozyme